MLLHKFKNFTVGIIYAVTCNFSPSILGNVTYFTEQQPIRKKGQENRTL